MAFLIIARAAFAVRVSSARRWLRRAGYSSARSACAFARSPYIGHSTNDQIAHLDMRQLAAFRIAGRCTHPRHTQQATSDAHDRSRPRARRRRAARHARPPRRSATPAGSVKGLVRPGRAGAVPRKVEPVEAVTRDEAIAAARGLRCRAQRAQSRDHRMAEKRAVARLWRDRRSGRERRDAAVSRQRLELRRRHAAGARRNHADAADHAQGPDAGRDRAAHPRGLRSRHARRSSCGPATSSAPAAAPGSIW